MIKECLQRMKFGQDFRIPCNSLANPINPVNSSNIHTGAHNHRISGDLLAFVGICRDSGGFSRICSDLWGFAGIHGDSQCPHKDSQGFG